MAKILKANHLKGGKSVLAPTNKIYEFDDEGLCEVEDEVHAEYLSVFGFEDGGEPEPKKKSPAK